MKTNYIISILCVLLVLVFVSLLVRGRINSNNLYKTTNLLVYILELFIMGTLLNLLFDASSFQSLKSPFLIFKDYVYANSIYSILITIMIKIWDGTTIDSMHSLHTQIKDILLICEMNDYEVIKNKYYSFNTNYADLIKKGSLDKFTSKIVFEVDKTTLRFLKNEINKNDYILFLKSRMIMIENQQSITNMGWQSSIFLRHLK